MLLGFGDEPPEFLPPTAAQPELKSHGRAKPTSQSLTGLQLMRAGWKLHIDIDGCRVMSPKWELINHDDILFLDPTGAETDADDEEGMMVFGATLYRLLAE